MVKCINDICKGWQSLVACYNNTFIAWRWWHLGVSLQKPSFFLTCDVIHGPTRLLRWVILYSLWHAFEHVIGVQVNRHHGHDDLHGTILMRFDLGFNGQLQMSLIERLLQSKYIFTNTHLHISKHALRIAPETITHMPSTFFLLLQDWHYPMWTHLHACMYKCNIRYM